MSKPFVPFKELSIELLYKYKTLSREAALDFLGKWQAIDPEGCEGFARGAAAQAAQSLMKKEIRKMLDVFEEREGIKDRRD